MAYVKNWLHCVWGTKNRSGYLTDSVKKQVLDHIKENAKTKGIYIDTLNGYTEHMHCLLSLDPDRSLSKVMQLIKGESSYWINKQKLTKFRFKWAVEYFGVSVSESQVQKVRQYIRNQEQHHRKISWDEEYADMIERYGFEKFSE